MFKNKIIALFLTVLLFSQLSFAASAAASHSECVSLISVREDTVGEGYAWNNRDGVLTIAGLTIRTSDDYGFKIPDGTTLEIKGDNYIKASKAAFFVEGNLIIRGNGTLTLIGDEYGIYSSSVSTSDSIVMTSSTINIEAGSHGIISDSASVKISGGIMSVKSMNGYSMNCRDLVIGSGVTVSATGSIYAKNSLLIQGANLKASSQSSPALICDKSLKLESMTFKVGGDNSSLSDATVYSGEKAIETVSTLDFSVRSILFGDKYPIALDIALLVLAVGVIAASIALPIYVKKLKLQKIIAEREAAEAEERKKNKSLRKSASK